MRRIRTIGSERIQIQLDTGLGKVQKHFQEEANINSIIAKYKRTKIAPEQRQNPIYNDFSTVESLQANLNQAKHAQEEFNSLPSHIRKKFQNDPKQLLEFVIDENNRDDAIKIGLIPKPEPIPETKPEPIPEPNV